MVDMTIPAAHGYPSFKSDFSSWKTSISFCIIIGEVYQKTRDMKASPPVQIHRSPHIWNTMRGR
ncbi:hypothetical protein RvY_07445 [Ramazzottius varieornatus]|uniref:Uncharacterized protein n=1 Tax=Ramazzottius varieornatus TaxID=947166 RepID=A0A1D1V785_RAMVA|nr:hypothetical protein RvY_07445 [Ramazzottius varieornatus]